jgi:hypothetical protein
MRRERYAGEYHVKTGRNWRNASRGTLPRIGGMQAEEHYQGLYNSF